MFNIFNSNVLVEVGEAIGDMGARVFGSRGTTAELVDEIFRRRLGMAQRIRLPSTDDFVEGDDDFIDVPYRILDQYDEEADS